MRQVAFGRIRERAREWFPAPPSEVSLYAVLNLVLRAAVFTLAAPAMIRVVRADGGTFGERVTFLLYVLSLLLLVSGATLVVYTTARRTLGSSAARSALLVSDTLITLGIAAEIATFLVLGVHPTNAATWAAVGTADVKNLPVWALAVAASAAAASVLAQWGLWRLCAWWSNRGPSRPRTGALTARALGYGAVGLGTFMFVDRPDQERLIPRAALPAYATLLAPARALPELRPLLSLEDHGPMPELARRPDIVLVMAESLRGDVFTDVEMPALSRFARELGCAVAPRHYAGGHLTQYGTFSLLYGIGSWAFLPYMQEGRRSWILDLFRASGYELIGMDASGVLSYAIPPIAPEQFDRYETRLRADSAIVTETIRLAAEVEDRAPRLIFTFMYGTHAPYLFPDGFERFTENESTRAANLKNRYRNSVSYADHLLGELIESARAQLLSGELVLVITGDHGEEFGEHGLMGHASVSFYEERVRVPLIICGLGTALRFPDGPTEHADIGPTLLAALGAEVPPGRVTGRALNEVAEQASIVIAGSGFPAQTGEFAIVTGEHKFWVAVRDPYFKVIDLLRVTDSADNELSASPALQMDLERALALFARQRSAVLRAD